MNKVILISSAILGLLLIAIYCLRCFNTSKEVQHSVLINTVFQSSGIVAGLFLIASIFLEEIKMIIPDLDIYIFISGIAVIAVSIQGFYRDAIKSTKL